MLYVTYRTPPTPKTVSTEWSKKPEIHILVQVWHIHDPMLRIAVPFIEEIQADGDELELILSKITGIPMMKDAVSLNWYGDHAKFIASALKIAGIE